MARGGDLPGFLAHMHPRFHVPGRAVLAVGGAAAIVAATGALGGVAAAAAFTLLIYYAITNVAALRMPRDAKRVPDVVPLAGLASCVVLALSLPVATILTGTAVLLAGLGMRAVLRTQPPP